MYLRSAMICPSGVIQAKVAAGPLRGKGHRVALPQEEHSPQADQDEVAYRKHGEAVEDIVVGDVNQRLRHTKCDICPTDFENDHVDPIGDIEHEADHIKQNRQFEEIHHRPIGNRNIAGNVAGFAILEVFGTHPSCKGGAKTLKWDQEQYRECPECEHRHG
jgi:hypothetical protein